MVESSIPFAAAVLAAPILNECPEKKDASIPAILKVDFNQSTKTGLDSGDPLACTNRAVVGLLPLTAR